MTTGRLVFAIMTTLYILVGILFEERDLLQQHGEAYRRYRDSTPALIPFARRASRAQPAQTRSAKAPLARRS